MRIRPIALCLGLSMTPIVALTAEAQYSLISLQDAGGQGYSLPYAINASGQSIGDAHAAGGAVEAVLWSPSGSATVLQDAGGQGNSGAVAINASGQSVGTSETASGYDDAVLWSPSGKATVLQHESGAINSEATAINDSGQSVGASGPDAMLWSSLGTATDLGTVLGSAWTDTYAAGINNLGDIVGYGDYRGGLYGFLLTPIPEPSTWMTMLVGFAGLGFAGYRRARSALTAPVGAPR
jgi:uncharacterized membrane protein